ncbi:MAG: hypothetical protein ACR2GX_07440 [Candidatus Dormibacteria bacterium]
MNLPSEVHFSVHQVRHEGTLIGEYELHIFRGFKGPVIVFEEGSNSPLPLEYLSEHAVMRFLVSLPHSQARFFERHTLGSQEHWVEVSNRDGHIRRDPCRPAVVNVALAPAENPFE